MSQPSSGRALPAYVYRRRRLAVLGGLLLVIGLIVLIFVRPGAAESKPPAATATIPVTESTATAAPKAPSVAACNPADVRVIAMTDAESYAADQLPQLSFSIENTGGSPCTFNVGTSQQLLKITSGSEIYWVSTDCQAESSDTQLTLQPNTVVNSEPIAWDRTRSNPGTCDQQDRPQVPAAGASYFLDAQIGPVTSENSAQFLLN